MDLGELFVIDSGPEEASFIVAAKAKSFVCQVHTYIHAFNYHTCPRRAYRGTTPINPPPTQTHTPKT